MAATIVCPQCNTYGATKFLWIIRCPNPCCRHYRAIAKTGYAATIARKATTPTGNFHPGTNAILVEYTNHEGERKNYTGDRTTLRKRRRHISLVLAPAGKRCAFEIKRIANLATLTPFLRPEENHELPAGDRQVLAYHRKRGSTSPRYEEVLRKIGQPAH